MRWHGHFTRKVHMNEAPCCIRRLPGLKRSTSGHVVIATARRLEVLEDLRRDGMIALPIDVTKAEEIEKCRKRVAEITSGKLDIQINNA